MTDADLERAKERAWREVAAVDEAYARGELDDAGWHAAMARLIVPAYLAGDERRGSGHTGSAADWEYSRGIVADAIGERRGTFLDIGCANGLLMESVVRWCPGIEPYGLDISPALVARARERSPHWASRIFVGNALDWEPPHRFGIARAGLEYVPRPRRRALVEHLRSFADIVIIGKFGEEVGDPAIERELRAWGLPIERVCERAHRSEPRLVYRTITIGR